MNIQHQLHSKIDRSSTDVCNRGLKSKVIDVVNLEPGDCIVSFKLKGTNSFVTECKTYNCCTEDTPIVDVKGYIVERCFNSQGRNGMYVVLEKNDIKHHFIFLDGTKVRRFNNASKQ